MPLKVTRRKSTGALTISGTVAGRRVRRRAQSDSAKLAAEEAAALEAEILRTEWHGERRGSRPFAAAALSYIESAPRTERTKNAVRRLLMALGDISLVEADQDAAIRARASMLSPGAGASTYLREVVTPLRAILNHAHGLGWCDPPKIKAPRQPSGRTRFLYPSEADRLILAAAQHLKPLLTFLIGTGARMSEALELGWQDVDLIGARAIFWRTKNNARRVAMLPPRVCLRLAALPDRSGPVFKTPLSSGAYAENKRQFGGQIKTGWRGAVNRSGLDAELTPHDMRHTWATWHYALHKDLLALKVAGGWSSVTLVERYAHLMNEGHETEIRHWLGTDAERNSLCG